MRMRAKQGRMSTRETVQQVTIVKLEPKFLSLAREESSGLKLEANQQMTLLIVEQDTIALLETPPKNLSHRTLLSSWKSGTQSLSSVHQQQRCQSGILIFL